MRDLAPPLLTWFARHQRDMPWRQTHDPYHIWVSEIMLQQTQVETVKPYYNRWITRFPTVQALAAAPLQDVLNAWEGLGYYSRARNLHAAAQVVVNEHAGQMPPTRDALLTLPGVGRYTAGAIASIAFNEDVAVVDGNVKRVLARVFNLETDIKSPQGDRELWALAEQLIPPGHAGDYNQALMELGATLCRPKNPRCLLCPLHNHCDARRLGLQDVRPVVRKRAPVPHADVTAGIFRRDGQVLITQRPPDKLLGGMWEFPGGKQEPDESLAACLQREIKEELGLEIEVGPQVLTLQHAFTHLRITLHVFEATITAGDPQPLEVADLAWVGPAQLDDYPMGKVDRTIANWLLNGAGRP